MTTATLHTHRIPLDNAGPFVLGGNAKFTLKNLLTDTRFTYKVTVPKDQKRTDRTIYFVSVLTGQDNESNFTYIGCIRLQPDMTWKFAYGRKSHISEGMYSVVYFKRIFNELISERKDNQQIEFWHEGRCCCCGRALTVPESIESGIGPECAKHYKN